jgi:hypothetical protein
MFVYGFFKDEKSAAKAVDQLVNAHFAGDDISALMHEGPEVEELPVEGKIGATRGALLGAALGAIGGALLAPGVGLLAGGPLLAALEAAIAGGAAGAGFGSFGGLNYWHDEIDFVHHHLTRGAVIVGVETIPQRKAAAEEALRAANAQDVQARTKKEAIADAEKL